MKRLYTIAVIPLLLSPSLASAQTAKHSGFERVKFCSNVDVEEIIKNQAMITPLLSPVAALPTSNPPTISELVNRIEMLEQKLAQAEGIQVELSTNLGLSQIDTLSLLEEKSDGFRGLPIKNSGFGLPATLSGGAMIGDTFGGAGVVESAGVLTDENGTDREVSKTAKAYNINFNAETSTANKRVSAKLSRSATGENFNLRTTQFEVSAPVDDSGETIISRIGEFTSDVEFKASFTQFQKLLVESSINPVTSDRWRRKIKEYLIATKDELCKNNKVCEELITQTTTKPGEIHVNEYCIRTFLGDAEADQYTHGKIKAQSFFGGSLNVGHNKFGYTDLPTNEKMSTNKTPWGVEGFIGRVNQKRDQIVRVGYKHIEDYKASDENTICEAPDENSRQKCTAKRIVGPESKDQRVVYAEYRRAFKNMPINAVTMKWSYDFEEDEMDIDVPIYVFSNSDGKFNGGFRLGWKQEGSKDGDMNTKDEVIVGAFVGSSFTLQ